MQNNQVKHNAIRLDLTGALSSLAFRWSAITAILLEAANWKLFCWRFWHVKLSSLDPPRSIWLLHWLGCQSDLRSAEKKDWNYFSPKLMHLKSLSLVDSFNKSNLNRLSLTIYQTSKQFQVRSVRRWSWKFESAYDLRQSIPRWASFIHCVFTLSQAPWQSAQINWLGRTFKEL